MSKKKKAIKSICENNRMSIKISTKLEWRMKSFILLFKIEQNIYEIIFDDYDFFIKWE